MINHGRKLEIMNPPGLVSSAIYRVTLKLGATSQCEEYPYRGVIES